MAGVDLQQVESNKSRLMEFVSDSGFVCSLSWQYLVNAVEQQGEAIRDRFIQTLTESHSRYRRMEILRCMSIK